MKCLFTPLEGFGQGTHFVLGGVTWVVERGLGLWLIHIASLRLLADFTLFLSLLESLLCRKGSELLSVSQRQGQFAQYATVGDRNGAY